MRKNIYRSSAFSLLELLFAMSLIISILLISFPTLQTIISKNRATSYTNELTTALQFARATAIKLGEPIILCGSDKNQQSCQNSWQHGLIVITATNKVLRTVPPVFAKDQLIWQGSLQQKTIKFLPTGFTNGQQGSFYYCPHRAPENSLAVILTTTGRIRIMHPTKTIPCNF